VTKQAMASYAEYRKVKARLDERDTAKSEPDLAWYKMYTDRSLLGELDEVPHSREHRELRGGRHPESTTTTNRVAAGWKLITCLFCRF